MDKLPKYIEMLSQIEARIKDLKFKTNNPAVTTSCTLFVITLDHAQGIKYCLINKSYPSAFSLPRILFETYIRAMWLAKCATPKQLSKYIDRDEIKSENNKKITFIEMINEVESAHKLPKYLSTIADATWNGLNSLTHSGAQQLHRNFNGKSIKHGYDDKSINEAIEFSTMISSFAFEGLCNSATNLCKDSPANKLIERLELSVLNTNTQSF